MVPTGGVGSMASAGASHSVPIVHSVAGADWSCRTLRHDNRRAKSARRVAVFYLLGALVFAGNLLPNGKRVLTFQVAKLRDRRPTWFREDATALFELLAKRKIAPLVARRIPLVEARRAHENLGRGGITGKQVLICDEKAAGIGNWAQLRPLGSA